MMQLHTIAATRDLTLTPVADSTVRPSLQAALTNPKLVIAERFLFGDSDIDPVRAHNIVKAVHACGKNVYPTLWDKVVKYVQSAEYHTLDKLSNLPTALPEQPHPFEIDSVALHKRTGRYVQIHSLQLGYIHYRNASLNGSTRQDCWDEFLQPV